MNPSQENKMNQATTLLEIADGEDKDWQINCNKSRKMFANKALAIAKVSKTDVGIVLSLFANEYNDLITHCQKSYVSMNVSEIYRNRAYDVLLWKIVREKLLSVTDYLTNIPNQRSCCEELILLARKYHRQVYEKEPAECRTTFSVILFDLDYFKKINDTYGHPAGDLILQSVANTVKNHLRRPTDFFGRYGGEEFIIFTEDNADSASQLAESIRQAIEKIDTSEYGIKSSITASFGVSEYDPRGIDNIKVSIEILKDNVDSALYKSKHRGRNQVTVKRL